MPGIPMKNVVVIGLVLCIQLCAVSFAGWNQAGLQSRPNLVLIVADDMGWGDVRSHGNDRLDTPVLDKLAADGARFNRFFVSPVCAPTRASLLTGRYHPRTGVAWVTRGLETMRSEELTLAEALRDAGYATGCFGKWHNGAHYPHSPGGQGFDEFLGFSAGHWNNYFDTTLEHNGRPFKTNGYITDVLTDAAIAFIDKQRGRPFFCYIPYNAPHGPFQVPERYFSKYKGRGFDDKTAAIYGMVENIDDNVGRILKQLEAARLTDRTIVLFLTDNGPNGERYNGGMKGIKGSVHEGGVRVPLFIRWPGRIQPGMAVEKIAAHIDLFPTLLELCGVPMPRTLPLDGTSLVPLLKGESQGWPERRIFTVQSRAGAMNSALGAVRSERHRLVTDGKRCELYDMSADPEQRKDIAGENASLVETLRSAYDTWLKDVTQNGIERLPIPVGYPQARMVELPAPESYFSGNLRFKGGQGWANDWITGWQRIEDSVSWEIDVVQPGRFEVTLLFTCPERDVGSRIRVEVAGQAVEGVIGRAHDPESLPSPDRIPRGEVYEKIWGALTPGALELRPGRNRLYVKALSKRGESVMELKAVRLSRLD
jgi:arylsulfatase A-like enzyme